MASMTGDTSSKVRNRWLDTLGWKRLRAATLSGLGFLMLSLFWGVFPSLTIHEDGAREAAVVMAGHWVRAASKAQVPADLLPEQIRLPEFPDPDELRQEQQPENREENHSSTLSLAALRVDNVAYQSPVPTQAALALTSIPTRLAPGLLSQARFGAGTERPTPEGRGGGWSAVGIESVGIGRVGGGTCGRDPATGPIIERNYGFPN